MSKDADGTAVGLLRDAQNRLVGHAKLRWVDESSWVANNEDGTSFASSDEDAPDISGLVPLVLVIAAGVAGVKVAQHIKSQREEIEIRAQQHCPRKCDTSRLVRSRIRRDSTALLGRNRVDQRLCAEARHRGRNGR
jgi:hypothetical protein